MLFIFAIGLTMMPVVAAQDDDGGQPSRLRIAVLPVLNTLPLYVAQAEGFYAEYDLDVELVPFNSSRDRQIALQTGNVDGANTDLQGVILLVNGGFDVRAVRMEPINEPYFSIVAGASSGITTIDDLRGKTIAISRNTIIEYLTTEMLLNAGFAPDEIVYEDVPDIAVRLELVNGGQVAAATLPEPMTTLAVTLQGATLIASDADAAVVPTVLAFNGTTLDEYGDLVAAFLMAFEKAVDAINADPERYRDVMNANIRIPEPLQATFPVPTFPTAVVPSEAEAQLVLDWMLDVELIEEAPAYTALVDARFLPDVPKPEATLDLDLSQSITGSLEGSGVLTMQYPGSWVAEADNDGIMLANSPEVMEKAKTDEGSPDVGEVSVLALVIPQVAYTFFGWSAEATPVEATRILSMMVEDGEVNISDPETFEAGGKTGAIASGTVIESGDHFGVIVVAIRVEGGMGLVLSLMHPDEVSQYTDLAKAMALSMEFLPEA